MKNYLYRCFGLDNLQIYRKMNIAINLLSAIIIIIVESEINF